VSEENESKQEIIVEEKQGFWAKNIISILLILFLIISGIYAFNRETNTDDKKDSVEENVEEIKESEQKSDEMNRQEATENGEQTSSEMEAKTENESQSNDTTISTTDSQITVKAEAGDGVTHLARKAVAEYTKSQNITLSAEQKLYAETVLKNQYYQHHLSVGQSIDFDMSSLENTIEDAQNLSPSQIENWSKYVPYVSHL
jgi:cytoskeletal protein RodZ